jgi:hypothetical protein
MNKYQRLIVTVAIIDLIVILLFPPFVERTLARNAFPSFDGFFFLLSELGRRPIDKILLSMELLWIAANALAAWLLLGNERRESSHAVGIGLFAFVNLAVICLFPPFEQYNSLLRNTAPGFDSFYFLFGDRSARPLFLPLLQLEIFFVLINALALFLVFSAIQRGEIAEQERRAADAAAAEPGLHRAAAANSPEAREAAEQREAERMATLGRKAERRHHADPKYRGAERRTGNERRHHG